MRVEMNGFAVIAGFAGFAEIDVIAGFAAWTRFEEC